MLRRAQPLLGTLVEIACSEGDAALAASEAAFTSIARVHALMSAHERGSDLSRFNAAPPGQWLALAPESIAVFEAALELSHRTQGVFDVCATSPAGTRGYWHDIEIEPTQERLRKHAPLRADLGGIAKGYAVDAAVYTLQQAGAAQGWVNAGGDLRVFGDISLALRVRAPWDVSQTLGCTTLRDQAAATSANYVAASVSSGQAAAACLRHGLTADPVTAQQSWTVTAGNCMMADALTKVVAATGEAHHAVLAHYGARAWIF